MCWFVFCALLVLLVCLYDELWLFNLILWCLWVIVAVLVRFILFA